MAYRGRFVTLLKKIIFKLLPRRGSTHPINSPLAFNPATKFRSNVLKLPISLFCPTRKEAAVQRVVNNWICIGQLIQGVIWLYFQWVESEASLIWCLCARQTISSGFGTTPTLGILSFKPFPSRSDRDGAWSFFLTQIKVPIQVAHNKIR